MAFFKLWTSIRFNNGTNHKLFYGMMLIRWSMEAEQYPDICSFAHYNSQTKHQFSNHVVYELHFFNICLFCFSLAK